MSKKLSDYIPIFADQGIDYVAAAPAAGVATQYQVVEASGVGGVSMTITLEHEMANANYAVVANDDLGNATPVGGKTVTTFQAIPGVTPCTLNLIIVGQLKGQK